MSSPIKYGISVLPLLLIVILSTCRKKESPPSPPENLGFFSLGEAKDYLLFKPGTWWVYKNTYTNESDSMVLTYCFLDTSHAESTIRYFDYENIAFSIKSHRDNATYNTAGRDWNPEVTHFNAGWGIECTRLGGYYSSHFSGSGISTQFYYPFDKSKRGNGVYETTFSERKDSLIVLGKTYYDIAVFSVTGDDAFPYPNIFFGVIAINNIYYWAKNYGLVKIEMLGFDKNNDKLNMDWELTKSLIKK